MSAQTKQLNIFERYLSLQPSSCDLVFLALHPPAVAPVLAEIGGTLRPSATFISLAPRVSVRKMSDALGGFARIVRMIPNAPSILGEGYNPVCFSDALAEGERKNLLDLFKPAIRQIIETRLTDLYAKLKAT